jgi:hypothetical protein
MARPNAKQAIGNPTLKGHFCVSTRLLNDACTGQASASIDDASPRTEGEVRANGGTMVLNLAAAPPPPTIDATVDSTASFDSKTGSATVHGTINCGGVVDFAFVDVELHQKVGRGEVLGFGTIGVACDGLDHPWSVEVFPQIGRKFAGGKGASVTFAVACGPFDCAFDFEEHVVQLSRRG